MELNPHQCYFVFPKMPSPQKVLVNDSFTGIVLMYKTPMEENVFKVSNILTLSVVNTSSYSTRETRRTYCFKGCCFPARKIKKCAINVMLFKKEYHFAALCLQVTVMSQLYKICCI